MGILTVDAVNYDSDLFAPGGNEVLVLLREANTEVEKAQKTVDIYRIALGHLIEELKSNYLTEDTIVAGKDNTITE